MLSDPRFTPKVEPTIPFYDVDMMGVAWHGNYFRYFEVTREAPSNQFSYGYRQMEESGYLWPVVDARMKYRHTLTFGQHIHMCVHIGEFENRLRIDYQIFDAETDKRATIRYTIQVAVEGQSRELCFVSPDILPERMRVKP